MSTEAKESPESFRTASRALLGSFVRFVRSIIFTSAGSSRNDEKRRDYDNVLPLYLISEKNFPTEPVTNVVVLATVDFF